MESEEPIIERHSEESDRPWIETSRNEAHLINNSIDSGDIEPSEACDTVFEDLIPKMIHSSMFVELPPEYREEKSEGEALEDLLLQGNDKETVLDVLSENNISLSIAMQEGFDQDPKMVEMFKLLNEKGITPTMWIVLDDKLGYWTNKANVEETVLKINKVLEWAKQNEIVVKNIGLDYEPPIEFFKGLYNFNIPKMIREGLEYARKSRENQAKIGNVQEYIDQELENITNKYNIKIETYAGMEPLRSISNWLTLRPNKNAQIVSMAYTSTVTKDNKGIEYITGKVKANEVPATGILGERTDKTPGRQLIENKKFERHLTYDQLVYNLNRLWFGKKTLLSPFRTHKVFALDSINTLNQFVQARKQASKVD
jgi:hypothetical protein